MSKLKGLGEMSSGMLVLGELGEMNFGIFKLIELGEMSFGMTDISIVVTTNPK